MNLNIFHDFRRGLTDRRINGRTDITADNDVYDISYNKGERKESLVPSRRSLITTEGSPYNYISLQKKVFNNQLIFRWKRKEFHCGKYVSDLKRALMFWVLCDQGS